ncbi:hypothetical protein [Rhodococcus sp. NPDC058514]|uniref:hypothetical protein n=1 Tax=unclassified Rhodococcus (in: high G+C Gram-positive bacteria) TaxID=192944 RepID=UPI00365A3190
MFDAAQARGGQALGVEDAEALKSIGIDLDAVRESLEASFGDDVLERAGPGERRGWFGRLSAGTHLTTDELRRRIVELLDQAA